MHLKLKGYTQWWVFLFLILTAFIIGQLSLNPKVGFLRPSLKAQWILAPADLRDLNLVPYRTAVFRKEIDWPDDRLPIDTATVSITAANGFEFYVNDQKVSSAPESNVSRNWKRAKEYSIREFLKSGKNRLTVTVYSTVRPPALLLSGDILSRETKIRLRSGFNWQVSIDDGKKWAAPEPVVRLENYYPDHLSFYENHPGLFKMASGLCSLLAFSVIYLAYRIYRRKPSAPKNDTSAPIFGSAQVGKLVGNTRLKFCLFILSFTAVYLVSAITRDPYSGFDAASHIDYIKYVAQHWKPPLAEQGWEFYQPPAYYFLVALPYKVSLPVSTYLAKSLPGRGTDFLAVKVVQALTPVFALFQIILVLKILSEFFYKRSPLSLSYSMFVLFLPMQIYMSPFVTNEVFSSFTISLAFYLLISTIREESYGFKPSLLLGLALSLAFLSKYTGLLIVLTVIYVYAANMVMRTDDRRKIFASLLVIVAVLLVVTAPYYLRNYLRYATPFPIPQDFEIGRNFTREYRGLLFLIGPQNVGLGALDKYISHMVSFVDGTYASLWLDSTHKIYPWTRVFDFMIYYLAIFPTFLILMGFCRALAACNTHSREGRMYFPFVVYTFLGWASYLYFVIRYFGWEIVRAFYMLSQTGCLTLFLALGLERAVGDPWKLGVFIRILLLLYMIIFSYYLLVPILIGGSV